MNISILDFKNGVIKQKAFDYIIELEKRELGHEIVTNPRFEVAGTIDKFNNLFEMKFAYKAQVKYECTRCREESYMDIAGEAVYDLLEEDFKEFGSIFNDETTINLDKAIFDEVYMNLPPRLLCKPDCKGICSGCGMHLNSEDCVCESKNIDPRFDKLKNLFCSDVSK